MTSPMFENAKSHAVAEVIAMGKWASARHWVSATSGNFSARIDEATIAITRSGPHKGELTAEDILIVKLDAPDARASAEAPLHYALYGDDPAIAAIYHFHSPAASVLSRVAHEEGRDSLILQGWELQKAFRGNTTHETEIVFPIFANSQDTVRLAQDVRSRYSSATQKLADGYLIAGHGLYAWGRSFAEARRHAEALETLCALQLSYERART